MRSPRGFHRKPAAVPPHLGPAPRGNHALRRHVLWTPAAPAPFLPSLSSSTVRSPGAGGVARFPMETKREGGCWRGAARRRRRRSLAVPRGEPPVSIGNRAGGRQWWSYRCACTARAPQHGMLVLQALIGREFALTSSSPPLLVSCSDQRRRLVSDGNFEALGVGGACAAAQAAAGAGVTGRGMVSDGNCPPRRLMWGMGFHRKPWGCRTGGFGSRGAARRFVR